MPIEVLFSNDERGALYRSYGHLTISDLLDADVLLATDVERLKTLRYLMIDHTNLGTLGISAADMRLMVASSRRQSASISHGSVAIFAPQALAFGLSRMWELLAHVAQLTTFVTRQRPLAVDWLVAEMRRRRVDTDVRAFLDEGGG